MSLTDIAELLHVTRQAVSKWELGLSTPNDQHRVQLEAIYRSWQGEARGGATAGLSAQQGRTRR